MVKLKLVSHTFPDDPDWIVVQKHIPLGTEYEMLGFESGISIFNMRTGKVNITDCYFVKRLTDDTVGYIPCFVLEAVES